MIVESLIYARSYFATPAAFRPYLAESIGLWARGRRQLRAWVPHVSKTLALIDNAIDDVRSRRTVAVLGSGPLIDVPLESLARNFRRVLLVDRTHLSTINTRVKRWPNVELHWHDLSHATTPGALSFLPGIPELDWVISVNLLSQLGRAAPDGEERTVIDAHLDGLSSLPCRVTLVTDHDYRVFDRAGTLLEEFDMLHGRALPLPDSSWLWEVAPLGEESHDTRRVHSVMGFPDWHAAGCRGAKELYSLRPIV